MKLKRERSFLVNFQVFYIIEMKRRIFLKITGLIAAGSVFSNKINAMYGTNNWKRANDD